MGACQDFKNSCGLKTNFLFDYNFLTRLQSLELDIRKVRYQIFFYLSCRNSNDAKINFNLSEKKKEDEIVRKRKLSSFLNTTQGGAGSENV